MCIRDSIITYAVMGAEDCWTPEERVWWQQLTRRFDGDDGADDTFIVPDDSVISEAQAVTAARAVSYTHLQAPARAGFPGRRSHPAP